MLRSRTVDPALFDKSDFRRASHIAREVWLGLICRCADDEGRLEADALAIADQLFSRTDEEATEASVEAALQYWSARDWLLLYEEGGKRYGHLCGWYEHQYIRDPAPSSYPPPPLTVSSWADVAAVRAWYRKVRANGGGEAAMRTVQTKTILRDFWQAVRQNPETADVLRIDFGASSELLRSSFEATTEPLRLESESESEGESEGEGGEVAACAAPPAAETAPAAPSPKVPSNAERRRQREKALSDRRDELLAEFGAEYATAVTAYVELAAAENQTGRITLGGEVTKLEELAVVRREIVSGDAQNGEARFRYGLGQAVEHRAPNRNYVKRCAHGWTPARASPAGLPRGPAGPAAASAFGDVVRD